MERKLYKTESKRLLDLMVNSIYTNKEIFLRELISNASDAIDKYHYLSLTNKDIPLNENHQIFIEIKKDDRKLIISDTGIGFTKDELITNLGTIAKSGSFDFIKQLEEDKKNEVNIIGQFGVGFYSAFMVSSEVEVRTKSPLSDKAYVFKSKGTDSYTIDECDKTSVGTEIILSIKPNANEENYDEFLEEYRISELVKKYSDYVRYPIKMEMIETNAKFDQDGKVIEGEYDEVKEVKTLNSMIPLWKKNKSEVTEEQLNDFYKQKFNEFSDPLLSINLKVEGLISYNALLFIPNNPPYNLYSDKFEKGLKLYTKGVFIMDKCKELIPDYLKFVKGLVDSSDLSLNISREILQQNRDLTKIAQSIEKKILSELEKLKKNDEDKYRDFFKKYGVNIKYGIYESYGARKDSLIDLLYYETVNGEKAISLKEYLDNKKEGQDAIYYASGKTKAKILAMPQMDLIKKQGFDVLMLTDDIDEFVMNILEKYQDVPLKSINQGEMDLLDDEIKTKLEELSSEKKPLIDALKEALKADVSDVVLSKRLTDSPVCLVSKEGLSMEMEKVINQLPDGGNIQADKVLEINPNHEIFKAIEKIYDLNPDGLKDYANILFNQALLIEGFPVKDPVDFSKKLCNLMVNSVK